MTDNRRRMRNVKAFISFVALAAVVSMSLLVYSDLHHGYGGVNWLAFGLFSVLLFLGETRPSMWMRFGEGGEVTPGWAFAYALLLLGSPAGAVAVMVLTNLYVDVRHDKGLLKIAFNASQIAVALSIGGLILHAFGVHGRLSFASPIPISAGIGIVIGGIAVFTINGLLTATVIGLHEGVGFKQTIHAGFALSMTADGALLAMAPIFVIAIEYSLVLLPLLGVTSFLVYQSARNALRREHEATHDSLTRLLNRRAFDARLADSIDDLDEGEGLAVLVMDLDRFKDINDRLGHQVGDRLLVSFAERLEKVIPADAYASRLGGDEFAVVIPQVSDATEVDETLARLHDRLSRRHDIDGFPLTVAVSIGAAVAPQHGTTFDALTAAADLAMYRAKRYETGVEMASGEERTHDVGRIRLLVDLSGALATSQIQAHYQPQVDVATGAVVSVEALMRWTHPTHGAIPPGEFIGVAEQTDLIGPITERMFETSMAEIGALGLAMPSLSVNVAPRSLLDRRFANRLLSTVDDLGFPPDRLEIEITERAIVTGSARSRLTLDQLREAGIRIAIDDFGTGYSSFLSLRDLPADRLKIDHQFTSRVADSLADQLIVAKVVELAHGLGLDVVAEGVESEDVWQHLGALGCDFAQGYAIARPMPIAELVAWMADNASVAPVAATGHSATPVAPPAASGAASPVSVGSRSLVEATS